MDNNEQEINLIDCIRFIIKGKNIILVFLVIGLLFPLGFVMFKKDKWFDKSNAVYESGVILEVGYIGEDPIENIDELLVKINAGFYSPLNSFDLKAARIPDTILIDIKGSSLSQQEAKNKISQVAGLVVSEHNIIFNGYKNNIKEKIANVEYVNNKFLQMGRESQSLQILVFDLQDQLENAAPSKIIKEYDKSFTPSFAKKINNIVFMLAIGVILGIFVGIFVVFVKSWWDKNKNMIRL